MQPHLINKHEIIRATDECVMCGLCLPQCPTYNVAQLEPESPRGRISLIRAVCEDKLSVSETMHQHLHQCLSCLSCQHACPANVDYAKIIDIGKALTQPQQSWINKTKQVFLLAVLSKKPVRKAFNLLITAFQKLGLSNYNSKVRLINLLPSKSHFRTPRVKTTHTGPRVAIIQSCANELVNDPSENASILLLGKLGFEFVKPLQVQCCGALHQHTGQLSKANKLKNKFVKSYQDKNIDYLVSIATGCGAQIKQFENELNSKVVDISELLLMQIEKKNLNFKPLAKKVFIHNPCTQKQISDNRDVVEDLLSFIPEVEITHFEDQLTCCGAGGMNSITHAKLADTLIDQKLNEIKISENSILVSSNIGCALHFQARLKQENITTHVYHPATLLAQQVV